MNSKGTRQEAEGHSDEEITLGMKMFDIKPDYYVDDNYLFYSYDEDSEDAIDEEFDDDEDDD